MQKQAEKGTYLSRISYFSTIFALRISIKSGTMPTNRPKALRLSKNQFKEQNRWQRW